MTIKHLGSIGAQEEVRIIHEKNAGGIEDQPIWVLLPVTYYIFFFNDQRTVLLLSQAIWLQFQDTLVKSVKLSAFTRKLI